MVEGPECHRVGEAHRSELLGRLVTRATSPNGKFAEGAAAIEGKRLTRIEVHGKALFYFFEETVVYIHFGMAGAFESYLDVDGAAEARPTTRLALQFEGGASALLSAMTVEHGTEEGLYCEKAGALGPDPLRDDADFSAFLASCAGARKKTIAAVLLDQSKIAGVGNILRSEICAHAGVHPTQPAATLSPSRVAALWETTRQQMLATFETGSIWDPVLGPVVYGRSTCRLSGGKVETWRVNGRAIYACKKRQRWEEGDEEKPDAAKGGNAAARKAPKAAGRKRPALKAAMVSAGAARAAKRARGEALNRQHTALKDGDTRAAEGAERAAKTPRATKKARASRRGRVRQKRRKDGDVGPVKVDKRGVKSTRVPSLRRSGRLRAREEAKV